MNKKLLIYRMAGFIAFPKTFSRVFKPGANQPHGVHLFSLNHLMFHLMFAPVCTYILEAINN